MAKCEVVELHLNSRNWGKIVEEIVRIEKKVFPKHESLAKSFEEEAKKRNGGLIYALIGGEIAGYVMYSWQSSLLASITKLAGLLLSIPLTLNLNFKFKFLLTAILNRV